MRPASVSNPVTGRWLVGIGLSITLAMAALGSWVLEGAREDAWHRAEQEASNLLLALDRDITRNIDIVDLSLQGVAEALADPTLALASASVRHHALFDRAASAEDLGSMLVLDADGNITEDSISIAPRKLNLADYDFFRSQRDRADVGLFVSQPFLGSSSDGKPGIALSRRLTSSTGRFAGIAEGTVRLTFFQHLFEHLDIGAFGTIGLVRTDGHVVVRYPYRQIDVDRDTSANSVFQHFLAEPSGQFVAQSSIDGIERLYSFRRLGSLPLILSVNMSVDEILAPWRHRALIMASVLVALCGATATLSALFRREMLRRAAAERALTASAQRLAELASTDPLTGLANRRRFDAALNDEWRRAKRSGTLVGLLLLDVDRFKSYNDRLGHQDGDECLRAVAGAVQDAIWRPGDLVARYGGEEFVVLLPNTDDLGAALVAERVRAAIEKLRLPHEGNADCGSVVTASVGLATGEPTDDRQTPGHLLARADAHLYEAKHRGRNRVIGSMPTPDATPSEVCAEPDFDSALSRSHLAREPMLSRA